MTEKNKFEKGSSNLSNKKTKKGNSWKHQMYELEIAIAKESNNKKRDELIKIHNGYMNEYDSLKKQIIWLAVLGICFLLVLAVFGYFIWLKLSGTATRISRHLSRDFLLPYL